MRKRKINKIGRELVRQIEQRKEVSNLRETTTKEAEDTVRLIMVSDLHWDHVAPIARSVEPCWYDTMLIYANQLRDLRNKYQCEIVCGGDVLNRWDAEHELVNWIIDHVPTMYSVAGNHDLPYHNYFHAHRSAYWTLVKSGLIINLDPGYPRTIKRKGFKDIFLYGFPCGTPPLSRMKLDSERKDVWDIMVAHSYIWIKNHSHREASKDTRLAGYEHKLNNYHAALFGDNHSGFLAHTKTGMPVLNPGSLMRRTIDQQDYKPFVGLFHESGKITKHYLDCSLDKMVDKREEQTIENMLDLTKFVENLTALGKSTLDFVEVLQSFLETNKISRRVKRIIHEVLEKAK